MEETLVKIDLSSETLDEGYLLAFGNAIKNILRAMFGSYSLPVSIKGSQEQINAFANTLSSEKQYIETFKELGLDNPSTIKSRYQLNKAINDFERKTHLIWPIK